MHGAGSLLVVLLASGCAAWEPIHTREPEATYAPLFGDTVPPQLHVRFPMACQLAVFEIPLLYSSADGRSLELRRDVFVRWFIDAVHGQKRHLGDGSELVFNPNNFIKGQQLHTIEVLASSHPFLPAVAGEAEPYRLVPPEARVSHHVWLIQLDEDPTALRPDYCLTWTGASP